jgi:hypothetical protein
VPPEELANLAHLRRARERPEELKDELMGAVGRLMRRG